MKKNQIFILIATILYFPISINSKTIYSKEIEIHPMRISYSDLQNLINRANSFKENSEINKNNIYETILIKNSELTIKVNDSNVIPLESNIPDQINSFTYNYFVSGEAPINQIEFNFNEYSRTLSISGSSPNKVDAAYYVLVNDIEKLSSNIGGNLFIMLIRNFSILIIFGFIYFIFLIHKKLSKQSLIGIFVYLIFTTYIIFFSPFDQLFTGFSAIKGDANILVRFGPTISFFGLLASLVPMYSPFNEIIQLIKEGKVIIEFK